MTYRIRVGSGAGVSSDGITPKVSLHNCVHNSFAFANFDQLRQTHAARERVLASQKERICGMTSDIKGGQSIAALAHDL